jgi:hypothetical protein
MLSARYTACMNIPRRFAIIGVVVVAAVAVVGGLFFVVNIPQRPVLSPLSSQSVRTAEYDALPEPNLLSPSDFLSVEYPAAPRGKPLALPPSAILPYRLVVSRPKNRYNSVPALSETIADQAVVQKLYTDLLALPPNQYPSNGPINCPMDTGIIYGLDFYKGNTLLLHADDHPTGCAAVALSDGQVLMSSGYFNEQLAQALRLSAPGFVGL